MAQQIALDIIIDGSLTISPFTSLVLNQRINDHHDFELRFNHDIKQGDDAITISKYHEYLGKSITITFGSDLYDITKNHNDRIFKGVITEISMSDNPKDSGSIVVKGASASVLLDSVEACSTNLEVNLNQILKKISAEVPSNLLTFTINPSNKKTIPYLVQYNETDYNFIKRLSAEYGEWLIYDGKELFFGKPSSLPVVELSFPEHVSGINFSMKVAPVNYIKNTFSLKTADEYFDSDSSSVNVAGLGNFGDIAVKQAAQTFQKSVLSPGYRSSEKSDLDDVVKIKKGTIASNLVVLQADSDNPGVHVGTIVDLSKNNSNLGKYLVTSVNHTTDGLGNYCNSFEAIPSEVDYIPSPSYNKQVIEPQIGKVIANKDPDGWGRIKVQLKWQPDEDKSSLPWMQIMTGSAGKGNESNRGFHFTPEIGDLVVVGFTDNDPSMPFVMGSIPSNDNRDSSPNKDNFEKVISTRSGNSIFFRDKENDQEQEILIKTDEGNMLSILVKNGDGTIEIKSSKEINVTSTKTINVKSETITIEGKDIKINANNSIEINANKSIKMGSAKIDIEAQNALAAKATQVSIEGSAKTEVKSSGQLSLEASAQASLKAGIVMIN